MELRLAEMREKSRLTQVEVSEVAGVSPKTEWNWEQGKSYPNAAQLWKMAVALECTPNDLLGWYDAHPREDAAGLSSDEAEVIGSYRECTPEWKRHVAMTALAAKGESLKSAEPAARVDAEGLSEAM